MRRIITVLLALGLQEFGLAAVATATEPEHCFDVLKEGELFAERSVRELSKSDKFLNWQCATSFRKHKHFLDLGLSPDTLVYGTLLSKSGRWKKSEIMGWKDENCSMKVRKTDLDAATFKYLKSKAAALLPHWASCMAERSSTAELNCAIEQEGNLSIFSATFNPTAAPKKAADDSETPDAESDTESNIATVNSWQVAGGSCFPALQPGSEINDVATQASCAADTNANLTVMLATDRGNCWQMIAQETSKIVIDGKTVLREHTTYEADVIELSPTAELVTNGFNLVISAKKLIRIEGLPRIVSFEAEADRPADADGRKAGPIIITAAAVQGSKLLIFNHGEHGVAGTQGAAGRKGVRGSPGRAGSDRGMKGCVGRKNGGKGRPGRMGQKGAAGGDAGDGGPVTIELESKQFSGGYDRFVVSQSRINPFTNTEYRCEGTCPGAAAPGGAGGEGGEGGRGGSGVRGSWPCGGVSPGTKGKQGKPGLPGRNGKEGEAGSILIL